MANKALRAEQRALCNSRCGTAPGPPGLFLPFKAPPVDRRTHSLADGKQGTTC